MRRPIVPRRVCRQCQRVKVRKAEHQYCSPACAHASRRVPRPLCPICRVKPCVYKRRTCSRSCGAKSRGEEGQRTRAKALAQMAIGRKVGVAKRLVEMFRVELAPFADRVPMVELAKAMGRAYRRGYSNGSANAYYRYVVAERKRAS